LLANAGATLVAASLEDTAEMLRWWFCSW
jgi:hypothetical protein